MTSVRSVAEAAGELTAAFTGQLLKPGDGGYDEARRVHNGLIDKRPALIARCGGVADVVDAVTLTRKLGLEVAVRGGGQLSGATIDLGARPSTSSHQKNVSHGRIETQSISFGIFRCLRAIHSNMRWISSPNGS